MFANPSCDRAIAVLALLGRLAIHLPKFRRRPEIEQDPEAFRLATTEGGPPILQPCKTIRDCYDRLCRCTSVAAILRRHHGLHQGDRFQRHIDRGWGA